MLLKHMLTDLTGQNLHQRMGYEVFSFVLTKNDKNKAILQINILHHNPIFEHFENLGDFEDLALYLLTKCNDFIQFWPKISLF